MFTPEALLASFCYILELSPVHLLAYYPFRDNFRFPSWMVFLLAGSNLCAQFFVCCYLYQAGQDARNIDIFFAVTSMIIYFSCIRTELPKLLFIYIMVLDYMMIIRGISVFLAIQFFYNPQTPYVWLGSPLHTMLRLFPCLLSAPFMLYFLNITKERVLKSYAPRLWSMVWLLPALTTFIVLLLTWNFNMISTSGLTFLIARMALLIIFITIYYLFIDSLESLRLQGEAQERARNQEKFISMQHLQYIQLQKQIEETRRARHDLRQHLNLIQAYLDKGDNETLRDYIDKYGKSLPLNTGKVYCSNYAIDTVIRYYAEKAADEKIQFDTQIKLPENLAIEEPDICILFGNLLENAASTPANPPLSGFAHKSPAIAPFRLLWTIPARVPSAKTTRSFPRPNTKAPAWEHSLSETSPRSTMESLIFNAKTKYSMPRSFSTRQDGCKKTQRRTAPGMHLSTHANPPE